MGQTTVILTELAGPGLAPGEQARAAAKCNYHGGNAPRRVTIDAEIASLQAAAGDEDMPDVDPDTLVAFPAASQMAILVTDRRLILWGLSLTGKPQKVLGTVKGSALASIVHGEVVPGMRVRITMKSGADVVIEPRKGEDLEAFLAALRDLVPTPTAS